MTIDWTLPVYSWTADGQRWRYGNNYGVSFSIRNVAPPKPEPVLMEGYCVLSLDADGGVKNAGMGVMSLEEAHGVTARRSTQWNAIAKVAWMSDGSPVPGAEGGGSITVDGLVVGPNMWRRLVEERDEWKAKAEALQAEVERMKPVVDAAVIWERHFSPLAGERPVANARPRPTSPPHGLR